MPVCLRAGDPVGGGRPGLLHRQPGKLRLLGGHRRPRPGSAGCPGRRGPRPLRPELPNSLPSSLGLTQSARRHGHPGALRRPHTPPPTQTPTGSRRTPRARPGAPCTGSYSPSTTPRRASRPSTSWRGSSRRPLPLPPRFGPGPGQRSRSSGLALCSRGSLERQRQGAIWRGLVLLLPPAPPKSA
jgi:hypothetical protein